MLLFNTLTKKKEKLKTFQEKKVQLYVCGITPYDTTHLGHAFLYMFFDVLVRYLRFKKYDVMYAQNVTDIDDDILKRAKQENKDWVALGNFWTDKFLANLETLNILIPDQYVKASGTIDEIVPFVEKLIER